MARLMTTTQSTPSFRTSDTIPPQVKKQIAELAYRLYEERGKEPGHELDDWLEAERRILGNKRR